MKLFNSKITLLIALLSVVSLWSCSDDVQCAVETVSYQDVPAPISADFAQSFPDATDVTWTFADDYAVATFVTTGSRSQSGAHSSVWYHLNDNCKKMHSAPVALADLPQAVTAAFNAGEYAALTPCDPAHVLTRYADDNVDCIYLIKAKGALEGTLSTVVKLFYTADGTLVKEASEIVYDQSFVDNNDIDEFKEWLPQTPADFVKTYVDTNYPGARYIYLHRSQNFTKAKILVGHVARTLLFDAEGAWVSTTTEIDRKNIPADVLAGLRASEFADWHIKKIIEYSTSADGLYYVLSLENGKDKAELRIDADGSLTESPLTPSEPENPADEPAAGAYLAKADIEGFILAKYPGATIKKYDFDDDDAEVEITCNTTKIKAEFDLHAQGYLWSGSEWDFDIKDTASLPANILKTISDNYSAYRLEYLTYNESPSAQSFYEAGLKATASKKTLKVTIDCEGNVIAEYNKH